MLGYLKTFTEINNTTGLENSRTQNKTKQYYILKEWFVSIKPNDRIETSLQNESCKSNYK